jgi:hypothetical protein
LACFGRAVMRRLRGVCVCWEVGPVFTGADGLDRKSRVVSYSAQAKSPGAVQGRGRRTAPTDSLRPAGPCAFELIASCHWTRHGSARVQRQMRPPGRSPKTLRRQSIPIQHRYCARPVHSQCSRTTGRSNRESQTWLTSLRLSQDNWSQPPGFQKCQSRTEYRGCRNAWT